MDCILVLNETQVDHMEVAKVSWNGGKSYDSFSKAAQWKVHLWDGRKVLVNPSLLESGTWEVLSDIAFPG